MVLTLESLPVELIAGVMEELNLQSLITVGLLSSSYPSHFPLTRDGPSPGFVLVSSSPRDCFGLLSQSVETTLAVEPPLWKLRRLPQASQCSLYCPQAKLGRNTQHGTLLLALVRGNFAQHEGD